MQTLSMSIVWFSSYEPNALGQSDFRIIKV